MNADAPGSRREPMMRWSERFLVRGILGALVLATGLVTILIGLVGEDQRVTTTGIILIVGGVPLVLIGGAAAAYFREFGREDRRAEEAEEGEPRR